MQVKRLAFFHFTPPSAVAALYLGDPLHPDYATVTAGKLTAEELIDKKYAAARAKV